MDKWSVIFCDKEYWHFISRVRKRNNVACNVTQFWDSLLHLTPLQNYLLCVGFFLLGLRGEGFEEYYHLKLFMCIFFTLSEVHVWFAVTSWLNYIKLTGVLYIWIKPYRSSSRYRWLIYAKWNFVLMAILGLSENKLAQGQDLSERFGIFLPIFIQYSFTHHPEDGKWAHKRPHFHRDMSHSSARIENNSVYYDVFPRISHILSLFYVSYFPEHLLS